MDFSALAGQAADRLKNAAGIIDKAIIEVVDLTPQGDIEPSPAAKPIAGAGMDSFNSGMLMDYEVELTGGLTDELKQMAKDARENPDDPSKKQAFDQKLEQFRQSKLPLVKKNGKIWTFTVQFNPSDMHIIGYSGGRMAQTIFEKDPHTKTDLRSSSILPTRTHIELSVRLLFDRTDPQDAFMADKFTMSATSIATGVAKAVLTAKGKKKVSVQPEVEAFIAAVRNPYRRVIRFSWGDMSYQGVLNQVSAEYEMFNVNGDPCRAHVDLRMICADARRFRDSTAQWESDMIQEFGNSELANQQVTNFDVNSLNPQIEL